MFMTKKVKTNYKHWNHYRVYDKESENKLQTLKSLSYLLRQKADFKVCGYQMTIKYYHHNIKMIAHTHCYCTHLGYIGKQ